MGPDLVVLLAPALNQHPSLLQGVEDDRRTERGIGYSLS